MGHVKKTGYRTLSPVHSAALIGTLAAGAGAPPATITKSTTEVPALRRDNQSELGSSTRFQFRVLTRSNRKDVLRERNFFSDREGRWLHRGGSNEGGASGKNKCKLHVEKLVRFVYLLKGL
ncbi:hypothetical protein BBP40_002310 [Aspergillus hancockii]|nr:hypothetical protein BBP40_002310 [Aspergillus hancockii]